MPVTILHRAMMFGRVATEIPDTPDAGKQAAIAPIVVLTDTGFEAL